MLGVLQAGAFVLSRSYPANILDQDTIPSNTTMCRLLYLEGSQYRKYSRSPVSFM